MKFGIYHRYGESSSHLKIAETVPKILIEMDNIVARELLKKGLSEVLDFFSKIIDTSNKPVRVSLILKCLKRNRKRITERAILQSYTLCSLAIEDFIYISSAPSQFFIYNSEIDIDPLKLMHKFYKLIDPTYKPGFTLILLWALWKIGTSK